MSPLPKGLTGQSYSSTAGIEQQWSLSSSPNRISEPKSLKSVVVEQTREVMQIMN